ncbi:MAG: hypothetical protein CR972_02215 [Candidatus Moraniibacteriota bacterium]|nr:MAG: hypothetical protein CR972_02215 [Candidatus Moranbacteria bacterium]
MKEYIKFLSIIFCILFFFSGCKFPWNQNSEREYHEEKMEMSKVEKELIFDTFIQNREKKGVTDQDLKKLLFVFDEKGIFDDLSAPEMLKKKSYEEKVALVGNFVEEMMQKIERTSIIESSGTLTDDEVPMIDIETGVRKYFFGDDAQERYEKYLAQRFNIGVYPTLEELSGEWSGTIKISKVVVFKEIAGSPNHNPAIFHALKGKTYDFDFVINANENVAQNHVEEFTEKKEEDRNEEITEEKEMEEESGEKKKSRIPNGIIKPLAKADTIKFPFAYSFIPDFFDKTIEFPIFYSDIKDNGLIIAEFSDAKKRKEYMINAHAEKNKSGSDTITGNVQFVFLNDYLKIRGSFYAVKK